MRPAFWLAFRFVDPPLRLRPCWRPHSTAAGLPAAPPPAAAARTRTRARPGSRPRLAAAHVPHRRRSRHRGRGRGGLARQPGRGSSRARLRGEDRRPGAARRVGRAGQGGRREGAPPGRRQERDLLHQQPHAGQRPPHRHRRRSDQHLARRAAADHGRGAAVPRPAEPARPGGVHRLSRARARA